VKDRRGVFKLVAFVAALDWVAANAKRPAVASLSLGVPAGQWSRALEDAVKGLVASGVPVVVAAGNDAQDSCQVRGGSVVTRSG
jgi:subtilisin family serine protease